MIWYLSILTKIFSSIVFLNNKLEPRQGSELKIIFEGSYCLNCCAMGQGFLKWSTGQECPWQSRHWHIQVWKGCYLELSLLASYWSTDGLQSYLSCCHSLVRIGRLLWRGCFEVGNWGQEWGHTQVTRSVGKVQQQQKSDGMVFDHIPHSPSLPKLWLG